MFLLDDVVWRYAWWAYETNTSCQEASSGELTHGYSRNGKGQNCIRDIESWQDGQSSRRIGFSEEPVQADVFGDAVVGGHEEVIVIMLDLSF